MFNKMFNKGHGMFKIKRCGCLIIIINFILYYKINLSVIDYNFIIIK